MMKRRVWIIGVVCATLLAGNGLAEDVSTLDYAAGRVQFWSPTKITLIHGELRFIFPLDEVDAKTYHTSIKWLCKGILSKPHLFTGVTSLTFLNRSATQGYIYKPTDQPLSRKCAAMANMFSLNQAFASFVGPGTRNF